jgi:antitoxin CcdA
MINELPTSGAAPARARRGTNLTLDPALVEKARALKINISQASERGLRDAIAKVEAERWREENAEAFAAYNRFVEEQGLPLEKLRLF